MERNPRRRTGTLLAVAALLASLTVATFATPAAAANPRVAIVQGMPGVRVDICIDAKEVKSRMVYGSSVFRNVTAGIHKIRVYRTDPRKCRGQLLAKKWVALAADAEATVVATARAPRIVVFDSLPGGVSDYISDIHLRHAADVGKAWMGLQLQSVMVLSPAAPTAFQKGDQGLIELINSTVRAKARKPSGVSLARSTWVDLPWISATTDTYGNTRHEFILVGTKAKNARFAVVNRPAPPAP